MRVAFLFPGQGSQRPGMLHALPKHRAAREILQQAGEILHQDLETLDSPQAFSSSTAVQVAIFIAGVAAWRALRIEGAWPDGVAGLSVGAFAAAVASGAIEFADALRLVRQRAASMHREFPTGYGMAAIMGLKETDVCRLIDEESANVPRLFLAGVNAPQQIVIAGTESGLRSLMRRALDSGARKVERLAVGVPSHCPLLSHVTDDLAAAMAKISFKDPKIPYVSNRSARLLRKASAIQDDLASSVSHSVRWHDMTAGLFELGVRLFVEMPPNHTLTDLAASGFPEARALALELTRFDSVVALIRRSKAIL